MKKLIATLILSIPILTSCLDGPVIYFSGAPQRSTVIPDHPECIAIRPPSDFVFDYWTPDEYRAQGFDFTLGSEALIWTRHGVVAGYSQLEDSTVWGSLHCTKIR